MDHDCTIFVPYIANGTESYYRYDLYGVHFEAVYGGAIGNSGLYPRTTSRAFLPFAGYIPPDEWDASDKTGWTVKSGGQSSCKIVKGIAPNDATVETVKNAYVVSSVEVLDYGNLRHIEVTMA